MASLPCALTLASRACATSAASHLSYCVAHQASASALRYSSSYSRHSFPLIRYFHLTRANTRYSCTFPASPFSSPASPMAELEGATQVPESAEDVSMAAGEENAEDVDEGLAGDYPDETAVPVANP